MQPVPSAPLVDDRLERPAGVAAAGTLGRDKGRRLGVAALAAALALAGTVGVAALVSGGSSHPLSPAPTAGLIGGLPLQQASCAQWRAGTAAERGQVVSTLGRAVGGRTAYGPATTLTRPEAYRLFDHLCASPITGGFLLYELYIRAAGFRSVAVR